MTKVRSRVTETEKHVLTGVDETNKLHNPVFLQVFFNGASFFGSWAVEDNGILFVLGLL